LQRRDTHLDHEAAAGFEVRGDVAEALHLFVLGREVHDRVEDQVREPERAVDAGGGKVADRHTDVPAAVLGSESSHHRR
jgi:hypothetical protein